MVEYSKRTEMALKKQYINFLKHKKEVTSISVRNTIMRYLKPILATGLFTLAMTGAYATTDVAITPVNGAQSTTITTTVNEQATLTVPATAAFTVNDINSSAGTTLNVHADNIVLNDGSSLRLSLKAANANFAGPVGSTHDLAASKISWTASTWTNGTGASGTLSSSTANAVVLSDANASSVSNAALPLTLASDAAIDRAGNYTLTANWIVESVAP